MNYSVLFDCNNENGKLSGTVSQCQIGEMFFENCHLEEIKFQKANGYIKLDSYRFDIISCKWYIGNMLWNTYEINEETVLRLITILRQKRLMNCFEAPTEQYKKFDNGIESFTKQDLEVIFD